MDVDAPPTPGAIELVGTRKRATIVMAAIDSRRGVRVSFGGAGESGICGQRRNEYVMLSIRVFENWGATSLPDGIWDSLSVPGLPNRATSKWGRVRGSQGEEGKRPKGRAASLLRR